MDPEEAGVESSSVSKGKNALCMTGWGQGLETGRMLLQLALAQTMEGQETLKRPPLRERDGVKLGSIASGLAF